jgi:ketosteroid isomerase-like protein
MTRLLTFFATISILWLSGCSGARKEAKVENTVAATQAISTLRGAYAAFNRGDMEAAVQPLDAEIEWTEPGEFPGRGTYHGREAAKHYLTQSRAAWAEVSSEPERFIAHGNQIVVFVHARVRAKGSNEWQDVRLADVYTFHDGKAIQMRAFADQREALRWVGVNDPGATP